MTEHPSDPLLIYGSTGHTGQLVVAEAVRRGLRPILAGRDEQALAAQAARYQLAYRVATLDSETELDAALEGVAALLHVAGPFSTTARPMVEACVRMAVHYLDLTGELPVFEALYRLDHAAREADVMVMPGVGFAVVPSDCLVAHTVARAKDVQSLRIGLSRGDLVSRGSATTMVEMINSGVRIRRGGRIEAVPVGRLHCGFDFGSGLVDCTAMSWPDVFTAALTTGVSNIAAYTQASVIEEMTYQTGALFAPMLRTSLTQAWLKVQTRYMPRPGQPAPGHGIRRFIVVEAEDRWRRVWRSRLSTPDGYSFTATTALVVVEKVLAGNYTPGFATPAGVYGADLVLECEGAKREDLRGSS